MIAPDAALLLGACGGRPQTTFVSYHKDDAPIYKDAEDDPLMAKNWTPGGCTSQESQIRAHDQYQNEYNKIP